jgi:hypothetical protein
MRRIVVLAALGMAGVLGLAACGGGSSKTVSTPGGDVKVSKDGDKVTVEGKDGKGSFSAGTGTDLPSGFPKSDVPLPDGDLVGAVQSKQGDKQVFVLTYKLKDAKGSLDDYKSALEDKGFKVDSSVSTGAGGGFRATGTDWDVTAYGSNAGSDNGVVVSVSTHDASGG